MQLEVSLYRRSSDQANDVSPSLSGPLELVDGGGAQERHLGTGQLRIADKGVVEYFVFKCNLYVDGWMDGGNNNQYSNQVSTGINKYFASWSLTDRPSHYYQHSIST